MPHGPIDIAIVNYRGTTDTLAALERLAPWRHGQVWLVDNSALESGYEADSQRLREAVAAMPWVTLLTPPGNLGFGQACNLAFAQSPSSHLLLLNPDARIAEADILQLAAQLDQQPSLGAVSPRIYWNPQRSFVLPAAFPQTPAASLAQSLLTHSVSLARLAAGRYLRRMAQRMNGNQRFAVDFVAGAVLLVRRSAALAAGGLFDPDYFMFFEDADLSLRLRRAGYGLAIAPNASAVHEYRHAPFKAALMAQGQQQYYRKQFARFHSLSDSLRRVQAMAQPMAPQRWLPAVRQTGPGLADFCQQTQGAAVLALSPSMLMVPAMFRPDMAAATPFSEAEWALLEPGQYAVLLRYPHAPNKPVWSVFTR